MLSSPDDASTLSKTVDMLLLLINNNLLLQIGKDVESSGCHLLNQLGNISHLTEFMIPGGSSNYGNYSNRIFRSVILKSGLL